MQDIFLLNLSKKNGGSYDAYFDNMVNKLSQGKIVIFEVFTNTKDILKTIDDELGF